MQSNRLFYTAIGAAGTVLMLYMISIAGPSQVSSGVDVPYTVYEQQYRVTLFFLILSAVLTICSIALYVKQKRVNEIIYQQAITDELTQIHNRRSIFTILKKEMERARRHSRSLSIVSFDIDHFKKINDTHGHQVGDRVLTLVTQLAAESLRSEDDIGRIGGEEYMAVLPDTGIDAAFNVAERLRNVIADHDYSTIHPDLTVTISLGVTEYLGEDDKQESIYLRSDEALYAAKSSGRNQTHSH